METDGFKRVREFSIRAICCAALAVAALCAIAYAAQEISIVLNGRSLASKAIMYNQQVYLPLSAVREITSGEVVFDKENQIVSVTTGERVSRPPSLLFADDFEHGLRPEWKMDPPGSWSPANGDFLVTEIGGDNRAFALVGDQSWSDYCIDVDMGIAIYGSSVQGNVPPDISIICRAKGTANYVAFVIHPSTYATRTKECYWRVVKNGVASEKILPKEIYLKNEDSLHIRLVARGQKLTVYRNGMEEPFASYGAASIGGGVGLMADFYRGYKVNSDVFFDNFRVQKLSTGEELPPYPEMKRWQKIRP
jgi:hypothetical protein